MSQHNMIFIFFFRILFCIKLSRQRNTCEWAKGKCLFLEMNIVAASCHGGSRCSCCCWGNPLTTFLLCMQNWREIHLFKWHSYAIFNLCANMTHFGVSVGFIMGECSESVDPRAICWGGFADFLTTGCAKAVVWLGGRFRLGAKVKRCLGCH